MFSSCSKWETRIRLSKVNPNSMHASQLNNKVYTNVYNQRKCQEPPMKIKLQLMNDPTSKCSHIQIYMINNGAWISEITEWEVSAWLSWIQYTCRYSCSWWTQTYFELVRVRFQVAVRQHCSLQWACESSVLMHYWHHDIHDRGWCTVYTHKI